MTRPEKSAERFTQLHVAVGKLRAAEADVLRAERDELRHDLALQSITQRRQNALRLVNSFRGRINDICLSVNHGVPLLSPHS